MEDQTARARPPHRARSIWRSPASAIPFWRASQAGFDADGRLAGVRISLYSDGGWSLDLSEPILWRAMFHCDNAYYLPAAELTGHVCRTHKTSQTAFRGFGGPQGMLVIEEILDQAARRLAPRRRDVVRERNFYREGDTTHYGQPVKDAARIERIWRRAARYRAVSTARRDEIDRFNAAHPHRKRGLAITPVKFGISFTATFFNQAGALVLIYRDGSVQVNHGGTEMGQGLHTKIRQIAADALGLPVDSVRIMPTRTDKVPNTSATAASAGTDLNGAAVLDACGQLLQRLTPVAAALLDCDPAAVRFSDGMACAEGTDRSVDFARVCKPPTGSACRCSPRLLPHARDSLRLRRPASGEPFHYFAYGAAVAEVEIDGFTGEYRILRADFCRTSAIPVRPLIDRGQIEGGFLQGVGWLTLEELLWDAQGRLATAGASTYKLPSWSEVPEVFVVDFLTASHRARRRCGSKAVGEPPLMLAISVREAIRDAIAAFGRWRSGPARQPGDAGARLLRRPASPQSVRDSRHAGFGGGAPVISPVGGELLRAPLFHTPRNPFVNVRSLQHHERWRTADSRRPHRRLRRLRNPRAPLTAMPVPSTCAAAFCCRVSSIPTSIFRRSACSAAWAARCWTGWTTAPCRKRFAWRMSRTRATSPASSCARSPPRHHHRARLRRALSRRHGGAVPGRRGRRPAHRQRHGALRPPPARRTASRPRAGLSRQHRTDHALPRPRAAALRRDSALRPVGIRSDAGSLPDPAARARRAPRHQPHQREPARSRRSGEALSRGRRTTSRSTNDSD